MEIKKVILVFKTHFDIGFTDLSSNVIRQYSTKMLLDVLNTVQATEHMGKLKYVWTMPAWPLKTVLENCNEEEKKKMEHFINVGQIAWHALPFTSHTDFCGEEEYLESLRYGKELSEKYKKTYPIAAKMTDVPGHGRMLPEVLGASGIQFLHLGCNAFATPPDVPTLFFWEAPSGRRVLTMYCKGGYGSSLEAPKDWKFPVWMALIHTHDNCGPHSADFIRKLEKEAKTLYPNAEIVCGTMDDFARELYKCELNDIPVVKEDLSDTWIHGIGAYPKEVGQVRAARYKAEAIQKFRAQADLPQNDRVEKALSDYYENMHLFGEHTWGADVKTFLGADRVYRKEDFLKAKEQENYRFMEKSWEEQRERASKIEEMLTICEEDLLPMENEIWFYNPSAMEFSGWVSIPKGMQAIGQEGQEGIVTEIFGDRACYVQQIPPLSTVKAVPIKINETKLLLERRGELSLVQNHRYLLEFDETTGKITRLYDKENEKTLLKEWNGEGIFQYHYNRHGIQKMMDFLRNYGYRFLPWGVQDYGRENYPECEDESFTPEFVGLELDKSTITFLYKNEKSAKLYGDAKKIQISITLPPKGDDIFVEICLKEKQETPYLESGSISMPLDGVDHYWINKNGSVLNPVKDIRKAANHVYYPVEDFVATEKENCGIMILTKDAPLLSIGEDGCYQYRKEWKENAPVICFNLFNNMWGTNFPQWIGGDLSFRFVIEGYKVEQRKKIYEKSELLQSGILLTRMPVNRLELKLPTNMELLNWKKKNDGSEIFVTRDLSGEESLESIVLKGYNLTEVDGYERKIGENSKNSLNFKRKRFGLHIFRAEVIDK